MIVHLRKICFILLAVALSGCVSISVPKYIKDKHPTTKTFLAPYDQVALATHQALDKLGWEVSEESDPGTFEHNRDEGEAGKQTLIFTEIKEAARILYSRYSTVNVYLRALKDGTEVEVRTLARRPFLFMTFDSYHNDPLVNRLFAEIQSGLGK